VQLTRDAQALLIGGVLRELLGRARRVGAPFPNRPPDRPRAAHDRAAEREHPRTPRVADGAAHQRDAKHADHAGHADRQRGLAAAARRGDSHRVERERRGHERLAHHAQDVRDDGHHEDHGEDRTRPHAPECRRDADPRREKHPRPGGHRRHRCDGGREEGQCVAGGGQRVDGDQLAWYGASAPGAVPPESRSAFPLEVQARLTADVAGLCCAVLAVLAITAEYTTGTIRSTFAAMPRPRSVLTSKAVVVAAVAALAGRARVLATYFVTRAALDARPAPGQSLAAVGDDMPALLALGLTVVMYTLIGLASATVLRSAAAAIGTFVALWYVLPMMAGLLPEPWSERLGSVLPGALAGQLAGIGNDHSVYGALLSPWSAAALTVAYIVVPLMAAATLFHRRDA
jgi:hypothetical protein